MSKLAPYYKGVKDRKKNHNHVKWKMKRKIFKKT